MMLTTSPKCRLWLILSLSQEVKPQPSLLSQRQMEISFRLIESQEFSKLWAPVWLLVPYKSL